jgi:aminoglycoside phosphotransferase (APT) family kinase protein
LRTGKEGPRLAPQLPVAVPEVLGRGEPTAEFPLPWLVTRWIPGVTPTPGGLEAPDLARFVVALRGVDATGAPPSWRGGLPLEPYDTDVRRSIAEIPNLDIPAATTVWEQALRLPRGRARRPGFTRTHGPATCWLPTGGSRPRLGDLGHG